MIRAWLKMKKWLETDHKVLDLKVKFLFGLCIFGGIISGVTFIRFGVQTGWDSKITDLYGMCLIEFISMAAISMSAILFMKGMENREGKAQISDIISLIYKLKTWQLYALLMCIFFIILFSVWPRIFEGLTILLSTGTILAGILLVLSVLDHALVRYRIRHGLYGTCKEEAQEIITSMLELKSENGDGGGKMTLRFTQEELEQIAAPNESGGEAHA